MDSISAPLAKITQFVGTKGPVSGRLKNAAAGNLVKPSQIRDYVANSRLSGISCHHRNRDGKLEPSYSIADHGLFIADLIKQIAPNCDLSVSRVLSDQGTIDLFGLAQAIEDAIALASGKPIVFNLSLGFAPPLGPKKGLPWDASPIRTLLQDPLAAYDNGEKWLGQIDADQPLLAGGLRDAQDIAAENQVLQNESAIKVIDQLFGLKDTPNVLAIAAAGNDSDRPLRAWGPRLPAAIEDLLGVSARSAPGVFSSYSNLDDTENERDNGASAIAGDVVPNSDPSATGAASGIVGLYVSNFPPVGAKTPTPPENNLGVAAWTGTSFAAPILSGLAACVWSARLDQSGQSVMATLLTNRDVTLVQS